MIRDLINLLEALNLVQGDLTISTVIPDLIRDLINLLEALNLTQGDLTISTVIPDPDPGPLND